MSTNNKGVGRGHIFERLETALYVAGKKPSEFIPQHGMVLVHYEEMEFILRLILFSEERDEDDSVFAWVLYEKATTESGDYGFAIKEIKEAIFDSNKSAKDQILPPKNKIGLHMYKKLTGM